MVDELRLKAANLEKRKTRLLPFSTTKKSSCFRQSRKKITEFEQLGQQELALKSEGLFNPFKTGLTLSSKSGSRRRLCLCHRWIAKAQYFMLIRLPTSLKSKGQVAAEIKMRHALISWSIACSMLVLCPHYRVGNMLIRPCFLHWPAMHWPMK